MPKILISDFDKTLYTFETELINNIKKIIQFINNGNIFIIATGRNYLDISKFIEKYNIPYTYLICNDGGAIFDSNRNLIYRKDIQPNDVKNIYKYLLDYDLLNITYFDTGFDYVKNPLEKTNAIIIKAIDKEQSTILLNDILDKFTNIYGYISDYWINITDKNVSKSNGIKILCKMNNYNTQNIYTIGDTINDISMIKDYNGACMSNSTSELKQLCNNSFNSVSEYIDYIENRIEE